jgi:hypothetical protein
MIYSLTWYKKGVIIKKTLEKEESSMKKTLLATALIGTVLLSGCGASEKMATSSAADYRMNDAVAGDYYKKEDNSELETNAPSDLEATELFNTEYTQSEIRAINTQMLVYSCDMSIDVLEFDKAVDQIHDLINKNNGFIENERYSDGGSSSQWRYADEEKWKNFYAVIRIPSAQYEDFCKSVESVGDMRSKSASVQNLTTEYSDLKTTLGIYEAKEDRYLDMLKEIKDQNKAVSIEQELTNIQIEIARIKTRMNNIENDVAYSYINLNVNEVREYTEKPVVKKTDTFGQRLSNTLSGTWSSFLDFLEGALFVIIRVLPYLLLLGIFTFIIVKIIKLIIRASEKSRKKRYDKMVREGKINNGPLFPNGNNMVMPPPPMQNNAPMPVQNGAPAPNPPAPPANNNTGAANNTPVPNKAPDNNKDNKK